MTKKDKLKELLINEDEIFNSIVDSVKELIGINQNDGSVIFKIDLESLTNHQRILLYLIGAKFAHDLELREDPLVANQELAENTNINSDAIGARLSELRKEKKIKTPQKGKHTVNPITIKKEIENIIQNQ